nr:heavy-metal-associated domain-containing protein [Variovorax sp. JS1663]
MVTFQVSDMTCGHCATTITKAVIAVDKSAHIKVDTPRKLVRVSGAVPVAALAAAIRDAGYTPQEVQAAPASAAAAPRTATGCGCGCGTRKAAPFDARQGAAPAAGSCCH